MLAAAASALIWVVSPWLVGHREPWDASELFYVVALALAGASAGFVSPRPLWAHYLGAVVGQLCYEVFVLGIGPLFVLGAAFLLGYSVVFLVAAGLAGHLRVKLARLHANPR